MKRLNFSRDMIAGLRKNVIFLTTPYGDDELSIGAYDFYSFIKMRIIFHDYKMERKQQNLELSSKKEEVCQEEWESGDRKNIKRQKNYMKKLLVYTSGCWEKNIRTQLPSMITWFIFMKKVEIKTYKKDFMTAM